MTTVLKHKGEQSCLHAHRKLHLSSFLLRFCLELRSCLLLRLLLWLRGRLGGSAHHLPKISLHLGQLLLLVVLDQPDGQSASRVGTEVGSAAKTRSRTS